MKTTILLSIALILSANIFAQKNNTNSKNTFSYEFEFNGKISNKTDSIYNVYCVIDQSNFDGDKKLNIKKNNSNESEIIPNKIKGGKCYFLLGESTDEVTNFEISKKDKQGNKQKLLLK